RSGQTSQLMTSVMGCGIRGQGHSSIETGKEGNLMLKRTLFAALLVVSGSAMASKALNNIPLVWSPTQSFAEFGAIDLNGIGNVKVQLNNFTDARKNPALIAENHEKNPVRQVTTKDNVASFVTDHVKETFGKAGLTVVPDGGDVIVSGEIRDFFVNETDQYVGNATVYVTIANASGKVLWQGIAGGGATNFGRSYKADNYYETLSNAVLKLSNSLLNSPGFHGALQSH
ncbi:MULTISPECIES: DUF4136 domain-containing protein, partial [unclassified Rhodanobacter]